MLKNCDLIFECFAEGYKFMRMSHRASSKAIKKEKSRNIEHWTPIPKEELKHRIVYPKGGKPFVTGYPDKDVEEWKQMVATAIGQKVRRMSPEPALPFGGALVLLLEFQIKPPLSVKFPPGVFKWPKMTKPDCDNYIKPVADATDRTVDFIIKQGLGNTFIPDNLVENDSRFFIEHIEKWYVKDEKEIGVKIQIYRFDLKSLIPNRKKTQDSAKSVNDYIDKDLTEKSHLDNIPF